MTQGDDFLKELWYIAAQELAKLWQKNKRNQEEQDRTSVSQEMQEIQHTRRQM